MTPIIAVAALLTLSACGGFPIALQVVAGLASASTLLKNEANCSLADISACTLPRLTLPVIRAP